MHYKSYIYPTKSSYREVHDKEDARCNRKEDALFPGPNVNRTRNSSVHLLPPCDDLGDGMSDDDTGLLCLLLR